MAEPRLTQLLTKGFTCASCGQQHLGLFDLAYDHPDPWTGPRGGEPNAALSSALAEGRDILTEDFCVMGEHRFVRAILPLSVIGSDQDFAFGLWGTLSQANFLAYLEQFENPTRSMTPQYSAGSPTACRGPKMPSCVQS